MGQLELDLCGWGHGQVATYRKHGNENSVSIKRGNSLSSWESVSFSRMTLGVVVAEFKARLLSWRLPPVQTEAIETKPYVKISDVMSRIWSDSVRSATDSTIGWLQALAERSEMNSTVNHLQPSGHYTYSPVVTIRTAQWSLYVQPSGHYMYHKFNIQQFCVLPTQCIYMFCVDLRTNSDYFTVQH